jgi:hypothetical protein
MFQNIKSKQSILKSHIYIYIYVFLIYIAFLDFLFFTIVIKTRPPLKRIFFKNQVQI